MTEAAHTEQGENLWTPANVVTIARICLVPVFVAAFLSPWPEWINIDFISDHTKSLVAAAIFIIISCTDWIDGYLARSRGEVTDFGKFMDPLADKILVTAALLALVELQSLPSWPVLIILAREFIVSGVRMIAASKGVVIAASWYGKAKTVFQMIAIVLFILKDNFTFETAGAAFTSPMFLTAWAVMVIALVLTVLSMLDYLSKARHLIGFRPSKRASKHPIDLSPIQMRTMNAALAANIIPRAQEARLTLGTAESLTGGLIAGTLTGVPGSSSTVKGSVVSYVDEVKHSMLGVAEETLRSVGAVSSETACEMADGARRALHCDVAVAVTGVAGPSESEGKSVGTVWVALATESSVAATLFNFKGDRESIRLQTVTAALEAIGEFLKEEGEDN